MSTDGTISRRITDRDGLENFWSSLERGLRGTHVAVEPFHLLRYVDEQAFRYNNRMDANGKKLKDGERFDLALSQIAGKRLTFAEVTGKVGETAKDYRFSREAREEGLCFFSASISDLSSERGTDRTFFRASVNFAYSPCSFLAEGPGRCDVSVSLFPSS